MVELQKVVDTTSSEVWKLTKPVSADAKADVVSGIVNQFSRLLAAEWEEDPAILADSRTMGFDKPELVATLMFSDGSAKTITVGRAKQGKNMFWVKASDKGDVFLVSDYTIQAFDKKAADLSSVPVPEAKTLLPAPRMGKKGS
jgi:hypothetical protein